MEVSKNKKKKKIDDLIVGRRPHDYHIIIMFRCSLGEYLSMLVTTTFNFIH